MAYETEIAALKAAIASGATEVRDGDRTVRYDSFSALLERLNWLLNQQSGTASSPTVGLSAFDRGDS